MKKNGQVAGIKKTIPHFTSQQLALAVAMIEANRKIQSEAHQAQKMADAAKAIIMQAAAGAPLIFVSDPTPNGMSEVAVTIQECHRVAYSVPDSTYYSVKVVE